MAPRGSPPQPPAGKAGVNRGALPETRRRRATQEGGTELPPYCHVWQKLSLMHKDGTDEGTGLGLKPRVLSVPPATLTNAVSLFYK